MKIGIEIHVQLTTGTKLFCSCANKFVNTPNTNTCECCLGMPGSKPRINEKAVDYAIKIALALNCKFPEETFFSRKSYFYPDLPKDFQISQYEVPLGTGGFLAAGRKKISIRRIHMEEDPGRIVHVGGDITTAQYVLLDYNRSGVPLCEIVTEPDFSSPKEVRIWLQELSSMLQYLEVFNPDVEGSMRVDANISMEGGVRVEVKNISGFKDVEKALNYEIIRQKNLLKRGQKVIMETRAWDAAASVTRSLRTKEEEMDYGYIFEGDLPRISLPKEKINAIRKSLPEFASDKIKKYKKMGIAEELSTSIASEPDLAAMFESVAGNVDAQLAAKWFAGEIKKTLNYSNLRIKDTKLAKEDIISLIKLLENRTLTEKSAELILRDMIASERPGKVLREKAVPRISDESVLEKLVKEVLNENPKAIVDYKSGKQESFHFLVGQVMKKTQGRGDPDAIRKLLRNRLQ